jgi:hypothetical protein
MNRRTLEGLVERTKRQYGAAYADHLVVLPALEKATERLREFENRPFDSSTRRNIIVLIVHLRVFFPLVNPPVDQELRAPQNSDSDNELYNNLIEHVALLLTWARFGDQQRVPPKRNWWQRLWDWFAR